MILTVHLAAALLCTPAQCHPALVGDATPVGVYPIVRRFTQARGYGGDVLQFADTPRGILAIHRVWLGAPKQRRAERLANPDAAARRGVTDGCINVAPAVYDALADATALEVRP